jgi:hypothetical protein
MTRDRQRFAAFVDEDDSDVENADRLERGRARADRNGSRNSQRTSDE